MGRPSPPCCEKMVVKKGSWTPEEDITLVSYIQEHGPGNWRSVPSNTGLMRCNKSCRLRWSNYLRPGIKRGGFTQDEEKTIIHLQALLGNRWSAMASYLHQRTDNDIKNFWNSHLKKKLSRIQGHSEIKEGNNGNSLSHNYSQSIPKGQWEKRLQTDIQTAKKALCDALSLDDSPSSVSKKLFPTVQRPIQTSTYALSADNIARLLKNWTKESSKKVPNQKPGSICESTTQTPIPSSTFNNDPRSVWLASSPSEGQMSNSTFIGSSFNSCSDVSQEGQTANLTPETGIRFLDDHESKLNTEMSGMPFSLLEKWLFDDSASQGHDGNFMDMALGESTDLY